MKYVCVEDNRVCGIMEYEPNVPDTVEVTIISDEEHQQLSDRTHYFDIPSSSVLPYDTVALDQLNQLTVNEDKIKFLASTDWKVLRHIREKALRIPTSLSEDEYFDLELQRHDAVNAIKR
jgi:hypothetical protein